MRPESNAAAAHSCGVQQLLSEVLSSAAGLEMQVAAMSTDSIHEGCFDCWHVAASLQCLQHVAIKHIEICPHAQPTLQHRDEHQTFHYRCQLPHRQNHALTRK